MKPVASKITDKRLSIEIASLRQSLWRKPGQSSGDPIYDDTRPKVTTDYVRWIDTDVMIADPLTKVMDPQKLLEALDSNYWSIKQPLEAVIKKKAKQLARRKSSPEENDINTPSENIDSNGE